MPEKPITTVEQDQKQRLLSIIGRLLPLVDSLADKLRLILVLGMLSAIWLIVWFYFLKHFSLGFSATVGVVAIFPALILARFWWALEELKNLPEIAGQMMGDAKTEFQASLQNLRSGEVPKLGFLNVGKSLWSVGAIASEARELVGSYISFATLVNPIMLVLGAVSFVSVFLLFLVGIILALFI